MNEVIAIWKTNRGKDFYFSDPIKIGDSRIFFPKANYGESFEADFDCISHLDLTYVRPIGKTDINNEKIYADYSVVKMSLEDEDGKHEHIGYFNYNNFLLCYEFKEPFNNGETSGNRIWRMEKLQTCAVLFEIIDTIQENKLGLIK